MTTRTLHDLAADHSWEERWRGFQVGLRGRTTWEAASYAGTFERRVRISRLYVTKEGELAVSIRYMDPDTEVRMVEERS